MITETYRIVWVCIDNAVQNGLGMSKIIFFLWSEDTSMNESIWVT